MIIEVRTIARSACRRIGIIPILHRVRQLWHSSDYEDKFAAAFLGSVRTDDCVWDVGANVGLYTEQLSKRARHVVAFEPVSENFLQLTSRRLPNVHCMQIALGSQEAQLSISSRARYSSIVGGRSDPEDVAREIVTVRPGDALIDLPRPNVVKIDVEGYEPEVIEGMHDVLCLARAAYIEVHFSILASRGMRQQPKAIVRKLKKLGFTTVRWVDASHIEAFREA